MSTDVRFYHLRSKSLDQALPELLSKAFSAGHRAVIRTPDARESERLNDILWTWRADNFLPHGTAKDGFGPEQPIWLTHENDNPNGANMIVLTDGGTADDIAPYAICCDMFDGRNDDALQKARERWKMFQAAGFSVTYWQQTDTGGWEKKA